MDQQVEVGPRWHPGPVEITVEETTFGAELVEVIPFESHTGKVLNNATIEFRTHGEDGDALASRLAREAKRRGFRMATPSLTARWRLGIHTSSYIGRLPHSTHHRWEIEQTESFKLTELVIGGVTLRPYRYTEKIDDGALIINGRVRLTPDEADSLHALILADERYFPVVRRGISDETRTMRFGQTLWSEVDGTVSHGILLVEKVYDERDTPAWFEPEASNVRRAVGSLLSKVDDLGDLLVRKGVLTEGERAAWIEGAETKTLRRGLNLWRVTDLDTWLAKHGDDEDEELHDEDKAGMGR